MEKKTKKSLWSDKWLMRLLALLLAIFTWIIIAGFVAPGDSVPFTKVNINYSYRPTEYGSLDSNLVIVGERPTTVTVRVEANAGAFAGMHSSDFLVFPDYSSVTEPGEYILPLRYELPSTASKMSVEPKNIVLVFEEKVTRQLPISAQVDGISAAKGFFKDTLVATPTLLEVSGPKSEMEKLDKAVAISNNQEEQPRDSSLFIPGVSIHLLGKDGQELDVSKFTLSMGEVEVKVPILQMKTLPVSVGFTGVPAGFDVEWLQGLMSLSQNSIEVAAEKELFDSITAYEAGKIDLSSFKMNDESYVFPVTLHKDMRNYENVQDITVSFDSTTLTQKHLTVYQQNIEVVNVRKGLEITPVNAQLSNVLLAGPIGVIEKLLPENVVVQIDASSVVATQSGQQTVAARILIPGFNRVFALGTYDMVCNVKIL